MGLLEFFDFIATGVLIPIGGLLALLLIGWRWGMTSAFMGLEQGSDRFFKRNPWAKWYLQFSIRYGAPILIIVVFLRTLNLL